MCIRDRFLHTRTSDGLPLTLGVSFQFTYNPTRLYDLYVSYKGQHRHVYENTATAVIANLACNFSAYEFFNDKAGITVAMQARVRDVFNRHTALLHVALLLPRWPHGR